MKRQLDIFAAYMAEHTDADDVRAGRGRRIDPGGDAKHAAARLGLSPGTGPGMLQRLRRELGWQAS